MITSTGVPWQSPQTRPPGCLGFQINHTLQMVKDLKAGKRRPLRVHEDPPRGSEAPDAVNKGLWHLRQA
jgi:hypothetical protein